MAGTLFQDSSAEYFQIFKDPRGNTLLAFGRDGSIQFSDGSTQKSSAAGGSLTGAVAFAFGVSPVMTIPTSAVNTSFGGGLWAWTPSTSVSSGTTDNLLAIGYNAGPQLGQLDATKPSMTVTYEIDYNDGAGNEWLEYHCDSVSSNQGLRHFIFSRSLTDQTRADVAIAIGSNASSIFALNSFSTQLFRVDPTGLMTISGAGTVAANSTSRPMLQLQTIANMATDYLKVIGSLGGSSPIFTIGGTGGLGEGTIQLIAASANTNGALISLFSNQDVTSHKATVQLDNSGNFVIEMTATAVGQMYFDYRNAVNWRNAGASETTEMSLDGSGNLTHATSILKAAAPSVSAGQIGYGATDGFGNGTAGQAVTTTLKGTGSGPTTATTIVDYIQVNIAGNVRWIPVMA